VRVFTVKTLSDMKIFCLMSLSLLFFVGFTFGHESENDYRLPGSFTDQIHRMCAGHHHFDDIELKKIVNQFSDHFPGILELQAAPPAFDTERYIRNLTSLVIFSDTLTEEQKLLFYRRSYDHALEAHAKGDEWNGLLGMLVMRTDALTLPELHDLMKNTRHEPMKPLIEEAIARLEENVETKVPHSEQDSNITESFLAGAEERRSPPDEEYSYLPWIISGLALMVVSVCLLIAIKRRSA